MTQLAGPIQLKGGLLVDRPTVGVDRQPYFAKNDGAAGSLYIYDAVAVAWRKVTGAVTSVAGRTGAVVLGESDITNLTTDLATLASAITSEASTRAAAVSSESSTRGAADTTLQSNIDSEASSRMSADTTLQTNINAKQSTSAKDQANGYAGLDASGLLNIAEFPSVLSLIGNLPNAKIIDAYKQFANPIAGSINDVYTVPTGRRALLCSAVIANATSGSASTFAIRIKIGATYFRISNVSGTVSPGTGGPAYTTAPPMYIAEAGETFAIEQTSQSLSWFVVGTILEFDNTAPLRTSKVAGVTISVDSVLYTPAAGKRGMLVASLGMFNGVAAGLYSCLPTGGTGTGYSINYLRGAVAASTSNRIAVGTVTLNANQLVNSVLLAGLCIANGDSIALGAVSATSSTALIWTNVIETPV